MSALQPFNCHATILCPGKAHGPEGKLKLLRSHGLPFEVTVLTTVCLTHWRSSLLPAALEDSSDTGDTTADHSMSPSVGMIPVLGKP